MADGQNPLNNSLDPLKKQLIEYVQLQLGDQIVDIELDPGHYEAAYQRTLGTYRQRAQNAYEESYSFMQLINDQNEYILPQEVMSVRQIFRKTIGLSTGSGTYAFDPFGAATLNVYLLNFNYQGGLATYDFYQQYVELAARMFGGYVTYTFNPVTKVLRVVRDFKGTGERVLIWADIVRPETELLQDPGAGVWITDFVLAVLKGIIGEAREKFGTIAGPGGGTSLNGTAMKAESKADQERLIQDLKNYQDYSQPLTWIQG